AVDSDGEVLPSALDGSQGVRNAAWVLDEVWADGEIVEVPIEERANAVGGGAHDGLLVHVEAGVDDAGQARAPVERLDDAVVTRIPAPADELGTRGAVQVHDALHPRAHPRRAVEGDRHELRRVLPAFQVLEA